MTNAIIPTRPGITTSDAFSLPRRRCVVSQKFLKLLGRERSPYFTHQRCHTKNFRANGTNGRRNRMRLIQAAGTHGPVGCPYSLLGRRGGWGRCLSVVVGPRQVPTDHAVVGGCRIGRRRRTGAFGCVSRPPMGIFAGAGGPFLLHGGKVHRSIVPKVVIVAVGPSMLPPPSQKGEPSRVVGPIRRRVRR